MKVIISTRAVYPFHGFGGMERYYYNLSKHLNECGIDVEIVTSYNKSGKKISYHNGIKYIFLPPCFGKFMLLHYKLFNLNVMKYLIDKEFDILHGTAGTYPYSSLKTIRPVIHQPFGLEIFKVKGFLKLYSYLSYYPMNIKMHKCADAIASEGKIQTKEIMHLFGVPKEKIFYLPVGINLDFIRRCLQNINTTRRELNLQDADIVLINVNRLEPNKGIPYLINALNILNYSCKLNVKLIIVGSGSIEENIKSQIKALGLQDKVVHFKNIPDEKMFQLYTLADISVTPTLYEGLPTVVLEAMACGKPVVASNVSEIPQVVKHSVNGFLVPPANSKAIADAVLKIYDKNLFMKMSKASKKIIKNYDWSKIAKMAVKKYEELAK